MYGEKIRELRTDHDETQEQLGLLIGVSRKQIARYEKEEQELTVNKLIKLCLHYKVSADYILGLPKGLHWPR